MSCISIYRPGGTALDEPSIIPFPRLRLKAYREDEQSNSTLNRARLLHDNTSCRSCGSCAVDPLELNDADLNSAGRTIPGTATIVAFHCNKCYHEWPARS
ncbi:hypothetical protein [Rubinisphaera sp.]|uniref:hypothetical protein n=1 Tax=Rubinisphaera sp. TaxID=2024857 RepID=UPI000C113F3B|nr:hypothetical protein [Rubinisphaera sp.]MBV11032.1 hypothetical protein [Rubinisphaera sp.]HCS51641.1 hypothetical protein [Planctomycetaceae bacterium]